MGAPTPSIYTCVGLAQGRIGNIAKPPLHATMQPLEQAGHGSWQGQCGRTLGVVAPRLARLATAFRWQAPGWARTSAVVVVGPDWRGKWASLQFLCNS
jgi:hypothetical protein